MTPDSCSTQWATPAFQILGDISTRLPVQKTSFWEETSCNSNIYTVIENYGVCTFQKMFNWKKFHTIYFLSYSFSSPKCKKNSFWMKENQSHTYFPALIIRVDKTLSVNQVIGLWEIHWASHKYSALCKLIGSLHIKVYIKVSGAAFWYLLACDRRWIVENCNSCMDHIHQRMQGRKPLPYPLSNHGSLKAEHLLSLFLTLAKIFT